MEANFVFGPLCFLCWILILAMFQFLLILYQAPNNNNLNQSLCVFPETFLLFSPYFQGMCPPIDFIFYVYQNLIFSSCGKLGQHILFLINGINMVAISKSLLRYKLSGKRVFGKSRETILKIYLKHPSAWDLNQFHHHSVHDYILSE